jgi:hypothetical protein
MRSPMRKFCYMIMILFLNSKVTYQIYTKLYLQVSQKWRTNYLLPMEKKFRQKNKLLLFLLLTVIQCKQRCTRTSLPCNVTVVDLKYFFDFQSF